MPLILGLSLAATFVVALLTLLFTPIYSATTILVLDSDLGKIAGGLDTPVPAVTNSDYIRYEFFASHSLQLMQLPEIAQTVIDSQGLRDRFGSRLPPEYFVHPSLFRLVYDNGGLGVKVDWLTDTQSFAITGISKDPDKAVVLSQVYANAFLEQNTKQYQEVLHKLLERTKHQYSELSQQVLKIDEEFKRVRAQFTSAEPTEDMKLVAQRIDSLKTLLEGEQLKGARYQKELDKLKEDQETFAKLKRVEESFSVNPNIDTIKTEFRQLAESLAASSVDLRPDHPDMKQVRKKLEIAGEALKKEAVRRYSQDSVREHPLLDVVTESIVRLSLENVTHDIQVSFYTDLIAAYERRQSELAIASSVMQNLNFQRDAAVSTLQQALKDQYKIESILRDDVSFFRMVSRASINHDNLGAYRYFPKRKRTVLLSFLIISFVVFFFIVGRELKANFLYFLWQLNSSRHEIGSAEVPFIKGKPRFHSDRNELICNHLQDLCVSAKAAPLLRISSAFPAEGKATITLAIAEYYQEINDSCLLLDGDTVGQSLSKALGLDSMPGLLDVEAGRLQLEETIVQVAPGMVVIPAGQGALPGRTNGLLHLPQIIDALQPSYAHIIYIEPPFIDSWTASADTLPSHKVIMVAESGRHSVLDIEQAIEMRRFNVGSAKLAWLVINKTPRVIDLFSPRDILQGILDLFHSSRWQI